VRIDQFGKPQPEPGGGESGRGRSASEGLEREGSFLESLEEFETRALFQELNQVGEQLSRFPSTSLVGRYRILVRNLLSRAQAGIRVRRDYKWRRTERSLFVLVERVEASLAELDRILSREGDRTRILSLAEEIKGCLISLLY
jgi:uncharacterized protein YaaR (DUF327 family)